MDEICGLCGKQRRPDDLVCPHCFSEYTREATANLRSGQTSTILDWVQKRAETILPKLRVEFSQKKTALEDLQKQVDEETQDRTSRLLEGQHLPQEQYRTLRKGVRDDLWTKRGGNKVYAQWKQVEKDLEPRIRAIEALLQRVSVERHTSQMIDSVLDLKGD
ncbi:MAG: hypothetical protein Q7S63_03060 [bacterium]|nr:hypothetical protein [bacterium]